MEPLRIWERLEGRLRNEAQRRELRSEWRRAARSAQFAERAKPPRRLLVLPCDPRTLTGSRGDEAMIQGAVQFIRKSSALLEVAVVTSSAEASAAAARMGFQPLQAWEVRFSLAKVLQAADDFRADAAVVVGGDVMDGYYDPATTTRLLALADVLCRRGVRTGVLGFSFNDRPHGSLRAAFDALDAALLLNVRDPVSLARFERFTRAKAQLAADAAFLLPADPDTPGVQAVAEWVRKRREAGDLVVGFNLHPSLFKRATAQQVGTLVDAAATALIDVSARRAVSWMLLPHDYRGALGDDACLAPLAEALDRAALAQRFHHVRGEKSAAELKALAGLADGVCTGRMHLAIASLGMGVPVAAVTYQDKFEGLFRHFELPSWLLLTPQQAIRPHYLQRTLTRFIDELACLRAQVAVRLGYVEAAAERNLMGLV